MLLKSNRDIEVLRSVNLYSEILMKSLAKSITLTLSLTVAVSVAAADGIPYRQVADMLYELAFANRKVYTRDIVQRLSNEESVVTASEHYKDEKGLPLPAQMFRLAAEELLDETGETGVSLRRSSWSCLQSLSVLLWRVQSRGYREEERGDGYL